MPESVLDVHLAAPKLLALRNPKTTQGLPGRQSNVGRVGPMSVAPPTVHHHSLPPVALANKEHVGFFQRGLQTELHHTSVRQPLQQLCVDGRPAQRRVPICNRRCLAKSFLNIAAWQHLVAKKDLHEVFPAVAP